MRARRKSVPVRVGDVVVGGAAEIVVQSMTKADTRDVKATLNEIARLKDANCRIVRVAVPTKEAAQAMVESETALAQLESAIEQAEETTKSAAAVLTPPENKDA